MPGIGLAIYGGIKAALAVKGIAGFFIKIGFSVGISYGAKLLTRLLSPRRPPLEALGGPKHTIRGEVVNARWILGKVRTAGVLCYFGSRSREARMGLILSEGACEKIDGQMWIDGHAVRLTRNPHTDGDLLRPVSGSRYYGKIEVREYFRADGTQGLYLRTPTPTQTYTYDQGDGTYGPVPTPWTERQKMAGVPPERAPAVPFVTSYPEWTTDHKLNGLSWVYVRLTQPPYGQDIDKRFWTRVPNLEFLVDGRKITWPGQTTPKWTENAAAVRYWWETERRGRDAGAIEASDFQSAYDVCEQRVDVSAGLPASHAEFRKYATAKRYTIHGVISAGDDVSSVEDQLDAAWAGEVIEAGGRLRFRPGVMRPATAKLDLSEKEIIEPPSVRPWPALQERINALDAEIAQSEAHEWTKLGLPKYRDPAAFERDGQERSGSIRLAYVTNPIAAGRLQAVNLRRARESLRLEVAVMPGENFERLKLIPTDVVAVTLSEFGFADKRMEVERVSVRPDWSVALTLREVRDDTYANTLVLPELTPRVIRLPDEQTVPEVAGLGVDEIAEVSEDGAVLINLIASWNPAAARETEVEIRELRPSPGR